MHHFHRLIIKYLLSYFNIFLFSFCFNKKIIIQNVVIKLNCLTVEKIENTRTERTVKEFVYDNNYNYYKSYLIVKEHS